MVAVAAVGAGVSSTDSTTVVGMGVKPVANRGNVKVADKAVSIGVVSCAELSTRATALRGLGYVSDDEGVKVKAAAIGARIKSGYG